LKALHARSSDEPELAGAISSDAIAVGAIRESSNAIVNDGDPGENRASSAGAVYVLNSIAHPRVHSFGTGVLLRADLPAATEFTPLDFLTDALAHELAAPPIPNAPALVERP